MGSLLEGAVVAQGGEVAEQEVEEVHLCRKIKTRIKSTLNSRPFSLTLACDEVWLPLEDLLEYHSPPLLPRQRPRLARETALKQHFFVSYD